LTQARHVGGLFVFPQMRFDGHGSGADHKSGVRSGGGMAAMAEVAYPLSEEEITALAHYLAHL